MLRREFCKAMAIAAASKAVPTFGQTPARTQSDLTVRIRSLRPGLCAVLRAAAGEESLLCSERRQNRPDKAGQCDVESHRWGKPPELPIPGGSWDGVPMESPIAGLWRRRPLQAHVGFAAAVRRAGVVSATRSSASGRTGARSACRKTATGTRATCTWRAHRQYKYQLEHYGHPSQFGYKDLCAQWTLLNWEPDELIARYKKAGAKTVHRARQPSRRLRRLGLEASAMERVPHWSASRRGRRVGRGGAQTGAALRRHGAPGAQLVVVPALARRRQDGPAGGRSLRWRSDRGRRQGPVVAGARSAAALWREASLRMRCPTSPM